MKKLAFIVEYSIRTRAVVEVPDDFNEGSDISNELLYELVRKSRENVMAEPANYLCCDNVVEVDDDYDCPYDPEGLDKEEEPKHRRAMLILADGTYLEENDGRQKVFDSVKEAEEFQKQAPGSTIFII